MNRLKTNAYRPPYGSPSANPYELPLYRGFISDADDHYPYPDGSWSLTNTTSIGLSGTPAICALSETAIVVCDTSSDALKRYDWNGSSWAQTGSNTALPAFSGNPSLTALDSSTIVYIDATQRDMTVYSWNGSTFDAVGSPYTIGSFGGAFHLAALSSTVVALADASNDLLYKFTWSGSSFTLNFSTSIGTTSSPAICKLGSSAVGFSEYTQDSIKKYTATTTWTQTGNALSVAAGGTDFRAVATLTDDAIAYIDATNDSLRVYEFTRGGSDWYQVGSSTGSTIGNYPAMASLAWNKIVLVDSTSASVKTYTWVEA